MRRKLTPDGLARVLRELASSRKEGILHISSDGVCKRIYVSGGFIIFAGSDDEQERLGEVLIRTGKLERTDLELALKVMNQTGEIFAKTITEMGFVSPADMVVETLERTKSIIYSLFACSSGIFHFEERATGVSEDTALELSIPEIILEAARNIEDSDLVRQGLGDLTAVLRRPPKPLVPYEEGSLNPFEWNLFQATGVSTIEEIVQRSPIEEDETLLSIYALVLAGILEVKKPERALAASTDSTMLTFGQTGAPPHSATATDGVPQKLGRYEVEGLLGRGAMGAVYRGRDPAIDRTVAIKLVQTAVQLGPLELEKYRERFYREAKAAGKLLHPGIVTVFDVGHTEEETPFIVMECVEGRTLHDILQSEKLDTDEVQRLAVEILDALAYAHSNGIVHRDVKAANVLVTEDRRIKIMDFGIAHVVGSELTQAGDVLGSPNYMAPEQLSKGAIDARTDLFAFGVMLYRMLTGELPFVGDSFPVIALAILSEEPAPPSSVDPAIPEHLSDAVVRCLAKDPDSRFATADEVKRSLRPPSGDGADIEMVSSETRAGLAPLGTMAAARGGSKVSKIAGVAIARLQNGGKVLHLGLAGAAALVATLSIVFAFSGGSEESVSPEPLVTPPVVSELGPIPDEPSTSSEPFTTAEEPSETEPEEPSDAELYHQASIAFERGEFDAAKASLEELLRSDPGFEGAPELLVKANEQLRDKTRRPKPKPAPATPLEPEPTAAPTEAELFYQAGLAFENGDLEGSRDQLEALLRTNPSFESASQLLIAVNDGLWKKTLPLSYSAKHKHRLGGCTGTVSLEASGIRYSSKDHEWSWDFDSIRLIDRDGRRVLNVETYETTVLGLGKSKNYRFELLRNSLQDEDWTKYRRLMR